MQTVWRMTQKRQMVPCEEPVPECRNEQVLVRLEYCGICGSDLRFYKHGAIGTRRVPDNFILGHECSGIVVQIGTNVKKLSIGDRVALEPGIPCGKCEYCKKGLYNLCPEIRFLAAAHPATDGALRQYMAYPEQWCFKLPTNVSTIEGCMIEPLAVGMHGAKRGDVSPEKTMLIIGAGVMGFMTLFACKAMGASKMIIADIFPGRLKMAKKAGAALVIDSAQVLLEDALRKVEPQGCDIVFECSGNPKCLENVWKYVKPGGVIVNVANAGNDVRFRFDELSRKEADIRSVWRYRNIFPEAIDAVADRRIDLKQIAPTIFPYEYTNRAFQYAAGSKDLPLKTIIQITEPQADSEFGG